MNERIKQLMRQACNESIRPESVLEDVPQDVLEKFAELIVGECAETVEVYIHESLYNGLYERGYNDGRNASASLIKQHFGVEK